MSLLVFGSTALDSIATPKKKNPRLLGGSGSHAAVAASFFVAPKLIGVVGTDFPRKYISLLKKHKVNLKGLKVREGKTFHWAGEYEANMNNRRTLSTELGEVEAGKSTAMVEVAVVGAKGAAVGVDEDSFYWLE